MGVRVILSAIILRGIVLRVKSAPNAERIYTAKAQRYSALSASTRLKLIREMFRDKGQGVR